MRPPRLGILVFRSLEVDVRQLHQGQKQEIFDEQLSQTGAEQQSVSENFFCPAAHVE